MDDNLNDYKQSPRFKTITNFDDNKYIQESPISTDITKDWSLSLKLQKNKFNQMIENAMNLNSYDINTKFDVRKYLPKEDIYSNSKIMRKYKDLLNNSNEIKYNNNINLLKNNPLLYQTQNQNFQIEKQNNQNHINNNMSISEIPIPTDSLFDMDSKIEEINLNFIDKKNNDDQINFISNDNIIKNENKELSVNINLNNDNEYFFNVFIDEKYEEKEDEYDNDNLNEIDKFNNFINKNNKEDYIWNCLDYNQEEDLIESFLNKKI